MFYMPDIISLSNGPSTRQQIQYSFENASLLNYDMVIVGNSRTYRGLNPDKFNQRTFNFSHDNDSYNQIYFKLKFLEGKRKKISSVILGLDYFQFSFISNTRNYIYGDLLSDEYLKDYDTQNLFYQKIDYYINNIDPKNLKALSFKSKEEKPFLKENGQYISPGLATENDSIERDIKRLDFQTKYFKKVIDFCQKKKVRVFIVMPPCRSNELISYSKVEIDEFNAFIKTFTKIKNVYYLNYSTTSNFNTKDYTDITHLNEKAANRFSKMLNNDINHLIRTENSK
ncbi:hypothetical protein Fluta_0188 [Fluviicola taffensis DSM 16823]|uniref:SGNH hydrolase-type esterase domain-containing protein n=2 Tax=Fluviicola TaxID=332102 RepID=F2IBW9_FLUTR|nr:hypothetical protein Fluta_0188 [Fluviicola taffensis DSM 16823]